MLEWVYPRTCIACGGYLSDSRRGFTCTACRGVIPLIKEPLCRRCGRPFHGTLEPGATCEECTAHPLCFDHCRSLFLHRDTGARIVHALKYEQALWLGEEIKALLVEEGDWAKWFEGACLIPVPLHPAKFRARGFNQSMVIARAIRAAFPGTVLSNSLSRVRETPTQTFLSRKGRFHNMRGAFACAPGPLPRGRLILVDDVLTTGATLDAAAKALHEGGAETISAFTLAHG